MEQVGENITVGQVKPKGGYMKAILFFVFIIALTASLYGYNSYLDKDIEELRAMVESREASIAEEKKDPELVVYSLIQANKKNFEILEERNKVTKFISHLKSISNNYGISLRGFKLSDGNVSMLALSESDSRGIAYEKVTKFIKEYRLSDSAIFDLDFIPSVSGYDSMKFTVNLRLK